MPSPGQVNNPTGSNSYLSAQGTEEPYGAIERRKVLTRMSPLEKNPALNEPRRAQQKGATKQPPGKPIQPHAAQAQAQADGQARAQPERPVDPVAQFWMELAAEPDASPLVRQYAAMAAGQR
jgi:hypothetical protein